VGPFWNAFNRHERTAPRPAGTGPYIWPPVSGKAKARVARSILIIIWHLLADPAARFTDLGYDYYQARTDTDRKLRNHIRQIQALGFDVTLTRPA
jgi:hypothetical protein